MNFTYLKPKTPEDIELTIRNASPRELFNMWLKVSIENNALWREITAYEELKRRATNINNAPNSIEKHYVSTIEQCGNNGWYKMYLHLNKKRK